MTEASPETRARPSLSRNSAARFAAEGAGLVLGAVSATLTARWLDPSTKGTLAALMFLTGLLAQGCLLGLPDAAMVRVGRREASVQQALSSTLGGTLLATILGAIVILVYARLQLPLDDSLVTSAVWVACLSLPLSVSATTLLIILNIQERVVTSSWIFLAMTAVAAVGTVALVGPFALSVLGGAVGMLLGGVAGLVAARVKLRGQELRFRPRLDFHYLRPALRFGLGVQVSYLLTVAAARLDLLFVYALATRAEAGIYSVALTFGTLAGTVGASISYAAFPRLAQLSNDEAEALTARLVRAGLAGGIIVGGALAVTIPFLIRFLLGGAYLSAIGPAMLLVVGGVFWTGQWLLARAYAARGDASMLFWSFLVNLSVMLTLDVVLVPRWNSMGAALASVVGAAAGLATCARRHRRATHRSLVELLPRVEDVRLLAAFALRGFRYLPQQLRKRHERASQAGGRGADA